MAQVQMTSGKVLHEARERKGYDLNTVARRLRIRPDILRAIEAGDFNAMPPRGYTRNMVNAYARLLGLNPSEIVNMYLDEAYANQVQRARGSAPSSGFNMERSSRRSRNRANDNFMSGNRSYEADRTSTIRSGITQATRVLYDDGTRYARDDYGVTREKMERPGKSDRDFLSHHSGYDTTSFGYADADSQGRSGRGVQVSQTPNSWSASRVPDFMKSRIFIIIAAVVALALVGGIAFAIAGGGNAQKKEDVEALPVSGVADTTGEASGSASSTAVEIAPTSARVTYSVPSGKDCYVEIYTDGKKSEETITGPAERNVEVTGVWTITTYDNEALKLTVDGAEQKLSVDSNYNDMYAYTVDFPAILKKWNVDHGKAGAATTTATSAAATSANATTQSEKSESSRQSYEDSVNYSDPEGTEAEQTYDESQYSEEEGDEQGDWEEEGYDESQYYEEEYPEDEEYVEDGEEYYEEESYEEEGAEPEE